MVVTGTLVQSNGGGYRYRCHYRYHHCCSEQVYHSPSSQPQLASDICLHTHEYITLQFCIKVVLLHKIGSVQGAFTNHFSAELTRI